MNLKPLNKSIVNYYDVYGMNLTPNMINTLLLCGELEDAKIKYSSTDLRIIDLAKRKLIGTAVNDGVVSTFLTERGKIKLNYLKSIGVTR